jgi:diguanylate cyclase (GGDEF)-like protein
MAVPHGSRARARARSAMPAAGAAARGPEPEDQALLRVANAAAAAQALEEVLELAAEEARSAIGAASLAVSRWEREQGVLRTLINVGQLSEHEQRFPEDEAYRVAENPVLDRMLRHGEAYFNAVDDPKSDPRAVEILRHLGKDSDLAVPIVVEGESWGEVWACTAPGQPRFRGSDLRFLEAIAGQLSVAIGRAELFSRVSRLAYEDPLTGLANRRALEERLERAAARAAGGEHELSVIVCDLDGLKALNDAWGHQAGDQALCCVGEALVAGAAAWPGSLVGRLSGDEFCVIIEGANAEDGRGVASTAIEHLAREPEPRPSISCGVAEAAPHSRTPAQLLRSADAAQYAAKRRGGGQVCSATTAEDPPGKSERRLFRWRPGETAHDAARTIAELLDGELGDAPALDRLEGVAKVFAGAINAAAWTISWSAAGSAVIESVSTADDRDRRLRGLRVGLEAEVYALEDFPASRDLVRQGSGSFIFRQGDSAGEPSELELLHEFGYDSVLASAAGDREGTYLVELFGDAVSGPLEEIEVELRLAARAALPARPGSAPSPGSAPLERRSRNLDLATALGARLAEATDESAALDATVEELKRAFGYTVCIVVRLREDGLVERAASASSVPLTPGWTQPRDAGLIGRCLRENRPVLVGDTTTEPDYRATSATARVRSELDVPVRVDDRIWGAINVEETKLEAFDEEDVRMLSTVADLLGAALRSAALYERLERAYLGTAQALSSALEAKDSYTASHSHSIVQRAEAVGRLLGVGEDDLRRLRYGAAFHDIGKLSVPEATLNKRGALDADEWRLIERHTLVGERILAPVDFLADVRPLVRSAHERWDGFGYPDGLAGEDIPLGARIIFACDAYDAMTTDRPYRRAMSKADACAELRRSAGSQFDPRVVRALLSVVDVPVPELDRAS